MKIKNDKGITFIALILMVVLIGILLTVTVSMATSIMQSAKFENIETYLLLIKNKATMVSDSIAMGELDEDERIGTKQEEGEYIGLYKLSQADLNDIGVNKARAEDGYYIDYENDDVVYAKGITIDDRLFNRLSEIQTYVKKNSEKKE